MTKDEALQILDTIPTISEQVDALEMAIKALEQQPFTPQKYGKWIFVDKAKEHTHCSECDYGDVDLFDGRPHNYCPRCGAKMQESEG